MEHGRRRRAFLTTLALVALAGCTSSTGSTAPPGDERLDAVAERLAHFQEELAPDGVLVAPFLARGSGDVPPFDFDLEDGYVLTVYCIGELTLEVRIDGGPAGPETVPCDDGQLSMARNAPDVTAAESNIEITADNADAHWLAAVTRATGDHRGSAVDAEDLATEIADGVSTGPYEVGEVVPATESLPHEARRDAAERVARESGRDLVWVTDAYTFAEGREVVEAYYAVEGTGELRDRLADEWGTFDDPDDARAYAEQAVADVSDPDRYDVVPYAPPPS